jgi:hypothetical protein
MCLDEFCPVCESQGNVTYLNIGELNVMGKLGMSKASLWLGS